MTTIGSNYACLAARFCGIKLFQGDGSQFLDGDGKHGDGKDARLAEAAVTVRFCGASMVSIALKQARPPDLAGLPGEAGTLSQSIAGAAGSGARSRAAQPFRIEYSNKTPRRLL
jgi:hypothetical protein